VQDAEECTNKERIFGLRGVELLSQIRQLVERRAVEKLRHGWRHIYDIYIRLKSPR
jgi:hypothetical protein